ncbi:hypothetical protein Droror1_Dr00022788 [Drosera rotundifolia]
MSASGKATAAAKSLLTTLKSFLKPPWLITGPAASPEYRSALPKATEYRVHCPATVPGKAIVPTSNPETVFDIKYFTRDQRRNRPPIKRTVLRKEDVLRMMTEREEKGVEFPRVYLVKAVEEDLDARGGGYQ